MSEKESRILELLTKKDYETLYEENKNFIYHIINKFKNITDDYDELISCANLGFTKAIYNYDINNSSKAKFITYAAQVIQNEILMLNRRMAKHKKQSIVSYDEVCYENQKDKGTITLIEMLASDENIEEDYAERSALQEMRQCIPLLKPKEQLVIKGRIENKTQRDIALSANVSQSYVSRIEQQAINKLRKHMFGPKNKNMINKKNKISKKEVVKMNQAVSQPKEIIEIKTEAMPEKPIASTKRLKPARIIFETDYFVYEIHKNEKIYAMSKNKDIEMVELNKNMLHNLILDLQELQQVMHFN